jgi:hypothetical protein
MVRGKSPDPLVYLRQDVAETVTGYLRVQERAVPDRLGTPLFTAVSNRATGRSCPQRSSSRTSGCPRCKAGAPIVAMVF